MRCNGCRAAIRMTDLRGFTALSQGPSAQELIAPLEEYQTRLVPVIQRHGGSTLGLEVRSGRPKGYAF